MADWMKKRKIWIDLDNSPHVVFFSPVKKELEKRGYKVVFTARKCFQVCELADKLKIPYEAIGRHYGKNKLLKLSGLLIRSAMLAPFLRREAPVITISHGSRSQLLLSKLFGIPSILLFDYEHTKGLFLMQPTWLVAPEILNTPELNFNRERLLFYPGIKEDVYIPGFIPKDGFRRELGVGEEELLVTVRPPATESNYHNHESETMFRALMRLLAIKENLRIFMLPRNGKQKKEIESAWPELHASEKMLFPEKVVDGLNLIWHSDMVFSGGGTMNREAAALGSKVYSFFRGKKGAVDKYLASIGRLILLEKEEDLRSIKFEKTGKRQYACSINDSLAKLVDIIEMILVKQSKTELSLGTEG